MLTIQFVLTFSLLCAFLHSSKQTTSCPKDRPVFYVSPSGKNTAECTKPNSSIPCGSLDFLKLYVFNCSVFEILDDVVLSRELMFSQEWFGLDIVGSKSGSGQQVAFHCQGNGGLSLLYTKDIVIKNIKFVGCSYDVSWHFSDLGFWELSSNWSAILLKNTMDIKIAGCLFTNQTGSAILMINALGTTTIETSSFVGNKSLVSQNEQRSGGIVWRQSVRDNSTFILQFCNFTSNVNIFSTLDCSNEDYSKNYLKRRGGAIDINLVTLSAAKSFSITNCTFVANYALSGGALSVSFIGDDSHITLFLINSTFINNTACSQGGAILLTSDGRTMNYDQILVKDKYAHSSGFFKIDSCGFFNNSADWGGGLANYMSSCTKCNISFELFMINTQWESNRAGTGGFAIGLSINLSDTEQFHITATFWNNEIRSNGNYVAYVHGFGAVYAQSATVNFGGTEFNFNVGTALYLSGNTNASFHNVTVFGRNFGIKGGAIFMQEYSTIYFERKSLSYFISNTAILGGGAIYSSVKNRCCFTLGENFSANDTEVTFAQNHARGLNQSLYIQDTEHCPEYDVSLIILHQFKYIPPTIYQVLFAIDYVNLTTKPRPQGGKLEVALGDVFYLEPCNISDVFHHSSSGTGNVFLQPVSEANYTKNGSSNISYLLRGPSYIGLDEYTVNSEYHIEGPQSTRNVDLIIYVLYDRESTYHYGSVQIDVTVIPCKLGYIYSEKEKVCTCASLESSDSKIKCVPESNELCIRYGYWYSNQSNRAYPCRHQTCHFSEGKCPQPTHECQSLSDFCSIKSSNDVCWPGRGGILCSQCSTNYSFTFAAFACVPSESCSARNTSLLMLAVFLYWLFFTTILLVVLSLNLSVGSGFMYGIVYFYSVVTIYTENNPTTDALWLRLLTYIPTAITQLDLQLLGYAFKTCFLKSWESTLPHQLFRYSTPLFVACLIVAAITVSRYCRLPKKISLAENSPIHAICMLVLFSYTSLSCTSFKILIPNRQNIEGHATTVKIAPSIKYFDTKDHLPYAIIALGVEFLISLPICFFFLFSTCLSRWLNFVKLRLKPILDEFQACYRPECRWFAGFYFLARQLVYLVDGIFTESVPQYNVFLLTLNVLILLTHATFQPYQKKWLNVLDTVLLMDIVLLSTPSIADDYVSFHHSYNDVVKIIILPYALIIIPACYLFGVAAYLFLKRTKWDMLKFCGRCFRTLCPIRKQSPPPTNIAPTRTSVTVSDPLPLSSSPKEDDQWRSSYGDSGVREPLLEDIGDDGGNVARYGSMNVSHGVSNSSLRMSNVNRFTTEWNKAATD